MNPSDLVATFLLPVPVTLHSAGLEVLVPKGGMFPLERNTMIPLNWELGLSLGHYGLLIHMNQ